MTFPQSSPALKTQSSAKRILKILLQVVFMVAIFAALLWYVGIGSLYDALLTIKVEYLLLAFLMYFGINLFFTVRLRRVLAKDGVKTSFGKTLLAQYAGMLNQRCYPWTLRIHPNSSLPTRPKCACVKRALKHLRHTNHRVFSQSSWRIRCSNFPSSNSSNTNMG